MMRKQKVFQQWLTWLVICAQTLVVLGVGLLTAVPPTPGMTSAWADRVGVSSGWWTASSAYAASSEGIEYRVAYNSGASRYEVYLRPTATVGAPAQTLSAQVTLKAPHVAGAGKFTPSNLQSAIAGTTWTLTSRADAPVEDPSADYLSFELSFPTNNYSAFSWVAGQEILAFTFQNSATCSGSVALMNNSDPFNRDPNSANTNPANGIDVTGLGFDPGNDYLGNYGTAAANCNTNAGIEYRVVYNSSTSRYEVYLHPNATAGAPGQTLSAQITLKAPHVTGAGKFTPSNLQSAVAGTTWALTSRTDAPVEDPSADYLSFEVSFPTSNYSAFSWVAGQEVLAFTFQNSAACSGAVTLMNNSDPFNRDPNSVNTNPANQIDVTGLGFDPGNDYLGNYGSAANCATANAGIEYRVAYNSGASRYEVYLRPTVTAGAPGQTLSAQVTLKAPHVAGAGKFVPTNLQSAMAGTSWALTSRADAPVEDPSADYLSFEVSFPTNNYSAFSWVAGQEVLAFTFQNSATCSGAVTLMGNSDPFNRDPNSLNTNPANGIDVTGLGFDPGNDYLGSYGTAATCAATNAGVEYRVTYNSGASRYEVYLRSTVTAGAPGQTLSSQVTLKAPHVAGVGKFTPSNPQSAMAGTTWTLTSRTDAPVEDPSADYLSFEVSFPTSNYSAFSWVAGQEVLAFTFQNSATCGGVVTLMNNNDPFNVDPNSANTNPANQIDVTGLGFDPGNDYLGSYGTAATCATLPDLTISQSAPVSATQGTNFSYALVVTNTGTVATTGVVTVTDVLSTGLSFVSGSGSGFTCAAVGQTVTCTSSTAIAANSTATINLTVNPTTTGVKSNTASVIGGGDTSAAMSNTVNTTVYSTSGGIEYKTIYNTALKRYEIWMRASHTPGAPKTTSTAQVTIKAPHVVGSGIFTPTNITAQVAGTNWAVDSRTNGPAADTGADYISFSLDFPTGNHAAINWQAGQEILMFTFQNGGVCAGAVSLMENNDPFNVAPNNPGQQIDVLTLGSDPGNDFLGNYNLGQGDCDRDGDGVVNGSDLDDDGDGLLDSVEGAPTVDTDSDGIPDALDLDSDGDGLPDNIEAQTTAGYIVPSGTINGSGVDTAYGAGGLTPINTDGTDNPDYKDTDSDNAQGNDTAEAGLTKSNTDADKDGLDDGIDSNDSAFGPVNAGVTTPATVYPNTNGSGDVDYRDSVTTAPDLATTLGQPAPALMVGVQSNLPVTVTNQGSAPANGPITTTVALPAGASAPAAFSGGNGWNCTTSSQTVTCATAGAINNGSSSTFTVPVVAATAGSMVTFNATTAPVSGESNTGNNSATPLTTTTPVAGFIDGCFTATVTLNSAQEVPANASSATGSATVVVNTLANKLDYSLSFSGLTPTMAHIHGYAATGVSAGIVHTLPGLTSPQTGQWSFAEGDQANILAGLTYFNLHSATYSSGEIRGQIGRLASTACAGVTLPIKVILGGAYQTGSGLMRDQLRRLPDFPATSPYGDGASISNSAVLTANAIVDWVLVELRDAATPATISARQGALLQADGDVVGVDGVSPLAFNGLGSNSYYVAVKHRNHLGVMTAAPVTLSVATAVVDFTNSATAVYGANAQRTLGGKQTLWPGNANGNTNVIAAGPGNDISTILGDVLSAPGNYTTNVNYILSGYRRTDLNLDGKTLAAGPSNDVNSVLTSVFVHPSNSATAANYIAAQQLP